MKTLLTRDIPPRAALAVIVLALLATVVSGREKPDLAADAADAAPARAPVQVAAIEPAPDLDPARLKRARTGEAIADVFASPAPATDAAKAAAPASAPPLPFQFVARITDGGSTSTYVLLGEDNFSVKPGLVIGGNYRVEKVTEAAVTFIYLPLGTRQVLALN